MNFETDLFDKILSDITSDRVEALVYADKRITDEAEKTCQDMCLIIAQFLEREDVKMVVFGEYSGGLCLVVRSSERRADFFISADGCVITVVRVDENMEATKARLYSLNIRLLRESAEWVTKFDVVDSIIEEPEVVRGDYGRGYCINPPEPSNCRPDPPPPPPPTTCYPWRNGPSACGPPT